MLEDYKKITQLSDTINIPITENGEKMVSLSPNNFKIEYKLDSKGNVRLSTFNESNDINLFNQLNTYTTQGIGLNYQEEFTSVDDFTSFQRFLNIFRSKNEKRVFIKHKKHRKPIPTSSLNSTKDSITVKK